VTQEKVLTAQARQAVAKLAEAGIAFAITSGRPPRGMQTLISDLNITTVVAGFNGGVFITPRLDPIVMRDLPKDAAARTIELIEEHGDWSHGFIPIPLGTSKIQKDRMSIERVRPSGSGRR